MIYFKLITSCPYCGHENETLFNVEIYKDKGDYKCIHIFTNSVVTCNVDEGGCGKTYVSKYIATKTEQMKVG